MNKKFTVEICSDLDYEEMVADICYENNRIVIITQEKGIDNMEIEILQHSNISLKFSLQEFIDNLEFARKKLIEMKKID